MNSGNRCGSCNVCCTVLGIAEINKPEGTLCPNFSNGCSIQENKPGTCADFECGYLRYSWPIELRPDNSGVLALKGRRTISVATVRPDYDQEAYDTIMQHRQDIKNG